MKVIHVIKRIEEIDQDVRELKKLEKSVKKNKSFSTPIYMSIEKQINIILGERIKMLDLKIANPPETMKKEIEGDGEEIETASPLRPSREPERKKKEPRQKKSDIEEPIEDDIPMLTQDQIDARIDTLKAERPSAEGPVKGRSALNDDSVKILDIALEKGSLAAEKEDKKDKDKKVKFFRDNFPVE
ncbi:MAG: hypothetical protein E4G96_05265 [Chrysiogenales bacterium]|nr:MAG: hypothetical protein E4G96_05265 [Chrysiogenales bacterium]